MDQNPGTSSIESGFNINPSRLRSELGRRLSKVGSGLRDSGIEEEPHPEEALLGRDLRTP